MTSDPDLRPPAPMRLERRGVIALVTALGLIGALTLWRLMDTPGSTLPEFAGLTMGTTYLVRIDAHMSEGERAAVRAVIERRLDRVDRLMSTYDSTSELSRLNRHRGTEPFEVSGDMVHVLSTAAEVATRSGGAFDVTVAPLVDAWGFGPDGRPEKRPDERTLEVLLERVGHHQIHLDTVERTVSKGHPLTVIDLSAIAKGYGVEQVAAGLIELGYRRFLVEVGGELKAVGHREDGSPWRVGIESPEAGARELHGVVELADAAIATSGDYRNFYMDGDARYAHIIDPRSGRPIPYTGASVTVVHADATTADAWATALSVLGPADGYQVAEREGIAALFITRAEGGFRSNATQEFPKRVGSFEEGSR